MTAVRPLADANGMLEFTVDGVPAPQGSKRWTGKTMIEDSEASRPWRDRVMREARAAAGPDWEPLTGALRVEMLFRFPRPNSHFGTGRNAGAVKASAPDYKHTLPDIDKLARNILDALVEAGVFHNDGQVAVLVCDKRYAPRGGVQVSIRPLG